MSLTRKLFVHLVFCRAINMVFTQRYKLVFEGIDKMKNDFSQRIISVVVILAMTINPAIAAQQTAPQLIQEMQYRHQQAVAERHRISGSQSQFDNSRNRVVVDISADRSLQTGIKEASNGTTVVDIAAPGASGVSHNLFTEFNVDQQGLILNNSLMPVLTQLGGWTDGNRRLTGGQATIILNEVTGLSRSQLLGQIEIAGQSAEFVLANPNGISCNGCGFINTPRVTMVTGRPDISGGSLAGFNLGGGTFSLEGAGLNASNVDRFDIVTRAAKINAELYARQLNVFTGNNYFDYQAGKISSGDNKGEPVFQFALDASSLGAMYANSIQLVGTEKGLGVNSQGLIQSVTDLEISADGEIRLKTALANDKIAITSHNNSIVSGEKFYAQNISLLAAQDITNKGLLASQQLLELTAQQFLQQGELYAGLTAEGNFSSEGILRAKLEQSFANNGFTFVGADFDLDVLRLDNTEGILALHSSTHLDVPGELINRSGTIRFDNENAVLTAKSIDNTEGNLALTNEGNLRIQATDFINNSSGTISASKQMTLVADNIINDDGVIFAENINLTATTIDNSLGLVDAQSVSIQAESIRNIDGRLLARSDADNSLSINMLQNLDNTGGIIYSGSQKFELEAQDIINRAGSISIANGGELILHAVNELDNTGGSIYGGSINLSALALTNNTGVVVADSLAITATAISNNEGNIQGERVSLTADTYLSEGGILLAHGESANALDMNIATRLENTAGAIIESHGGDLHIHTQELDNFGGLINLTSDGAVRIDAERFSNRDGQIVADAELAITGKNLDNTAGALHAKNIMVTGQTIQNISGLISGEDLILNAPLLNNRDGQILADGNLLMQVDRIDNSSGLLQSSGQNFVLRATELDNRAGQITHSGTGSLELFISQLLNSRGAIVGNGAIALTTNNLRNDHGNINALQTLDINANMLENSAGALLAGSRINIVADSVQNNSGHIQGHHLAINGQSLDNASGSLSATGGGQLSLDINGAINNNQGAIISEGGLLIRANEMNNDAGVVDGETLELALQYLSNRAGQLQGSELLLTIPELDNSGGTIAALSHTGRGLQLQVSGQLNNTGGLLLNKGETLVLNAAGINNLQGRIFNSGSGALVLNSGRLSNRDGIIQSNTDVFIALTSDQLFDNHAGFISAARDLQFASAGELSNHSGNLLAGNLLSVKSAHIDNAAGLISANSLVLRAPVIDNTETGVIEGVNVALHSDLLNNAGVLLATGTGTKSLDLNLLALNNSGRLETYGHDLILNNIALRSEGGEIIHHGEGELRIVADGTFDNRRGTLATQGHLVFEADGIDNRAGQLIAAKQLNIAISAIDNEGGLLQSGDGLSLTLNEFNNSNGGRVVIGGSSSAVLNVQNTFNNQQGSVIYWGSDLLTLVADILDNSRQGTIGGSGAVAFDITQNLNNAGGNIISGSSVRIIAEHIENRDEGLIEAGSLLLVANQIDNHNSQIQAQKISISVDALNNIDGGIVLALGDEDSHIDAQLLINQSGKIIANESILIQTATLTNDAGAIASKKLVLEADSLDNGGLIRAENFSVQSQTLLNRETGRFEGDQLAVESREITNLGLILAWGTQQSGLAIYTDVLTNAGRMESHGENLELHVLHQLTNSGEILHRGNGVLLLDANTLDNNGGAITGSAVAIDTDSLTNFAGEVYGQKSLTIHAQTIDNQAGLLQADETLKLIANTLDNRQQGVLLSGNETAINVDALDNRAGLIAGGELIVHTQTLDNRHGEVIVERLSLDVNDLNNSDGVLAATAAGSDNLTISVNNLLNNASGLIYSDGTNANINAAQINNAAGSIEHIGNGQLHIDTTQLINIDGASIRSDHNLRLSVTSSLDNSDGNILANNDVDVAATSVINHGGTVMAGRKLALLATDISNARSDAVVDWSGLISADWIELTIAELNNRSGGRIEANNLRITASTVDNEGLLLGLAADGEALQLAVDTLRNKGRIESHSEQLNFAQMQLDNSGGNIAHLGSGALIFELEELINRGGVIDASAALTMTLNDLDNRNGAIIARGNQLSAIQTHTLNNNAGLLRGENLSVTTGVLDNTLGEISGNQLGVDAAHVINAGGWIVANELRLIADELDNAQYLNTDAYISGEQLTISAGSLNNQSVIQGEQIKLNGDVLDNTEGVILSVATEGDSLILDFIQGISNSRGHIESRGNNLIINSALDNHEGTVFMAGNGTLSLANVDNTVGELLSNGHLVITVDAINGFVANQLGVIQALKNINIVGAEVDNRSGEIKAGSILGIAANNLNNTEGLLLSTGTANNSLQLAITNQLINTKGIIETHADNFSLSTHNINNRNGEIRHMGAGELSINSDQDFSNDGGTILTTGDMSIAVESKLTNDGNLVAARSMQIEATLVENLSSSSLDANAITINSEMTVNRGRIQADTVSFNGDEFDNRAGQLLVSGLQENSLQFNLLSVDNSNAGLIENHGGDLLLNVAINNQGGKLLNLGEGVLQLTAVNNIGGNIYSAGNLVIDQQVFNNSNGGLLQSAGQLEITAQEIINRSGTIYSSNVLAIATESLNNTEGGELLAITGFDVTVDQTLDNSGGRMVSLAENMQINTGLMRNSFGEIVHEGNGNLILTGGSTFNNNAGQISTQGSLSLLIDSLLNNAVLNDEGELKTALISARNFSLTATELQNNGGQIQVGEQLSLTLPEINNQGGRILALGSGENALVLNSAKFDNSQGGLLQVNSDDLNLSALIFNNQGGAVNHQGRGSLIINGQNNLQNAGGVLQSAGDIQINQLGIDNRRGLIYGQQVFLTAENALDNSAGGKVAGERLAINADSVNNTAYGLLAGLGNSADALTFNVNTLDNSGGTLRSGADSWSLNLDAILNDGGSILHTGNNQLVLSSNNLLTTSGTIASTADLIITANGLTNHGLLVADRNLNLTSTGNTTNTAAGVMKGGAGLWLRSGGGLSNLGVITSGTALTIQLDGQLNNANLIVTDAVTTAITSASLTNSGTLAHNGSGSLALNVGSNLTNTGTVKSAGTLVLNATNISNSNAAVISANTLNASGFITVTNSANARIEAGNVALQGNSLVNQGIFVASNNGDSLSLNVNALNNSGALTSNSTNLSFMGNVTNSGTLTHAGSGVLGLGDNGSVNIQDGKISTAGTANLSGSITGTGDLFARLGINIGGSGTFNNDGSKLYTQGNLVINSAINNTQQGSMIADGVLTVNTSGAINNSSGHLQGANIQLNAGTITNTNGGRIISTGAGVGNIVANSVNNSGGKILTTNSIFSVTATQGDINNTGGNIHQQNTGALQLTASGDVINNNAGEIISYGALAINADNDIANQGKIIAGSFDLIGQRLTNSGTILGVGTADSEIEVVDLSNVGSIASNGENFSIKTSAVLNNTGGKVSHTGFGVLLLDAPVLFNASAESSITGNGAIHVNTQGHFTNSGEISSLTRTEIKNINALTNHGVIGSRAGAVEIQVAGALTNTNTISGKNLVDISAATVANSGDLQSDDTVKLTMDALNITGNINAGRLLNLNVTESINVGDGEEISTAGSLTLNTQGDVTNAGTIAAKDTLTLGGHSLTNNGNIEGGAAGTSQLDFYGGIFNNGSISSQNNLKVTAGSYINNGITAAAGDLALAIKGNITNATLAFFSGGDMTLGAAGTISNDSGTIMSLADMTLAGENGTTANGVVSNTNGRIESLGNMTINTGNLINTRTGVSYSPVAPTTTTTVNDPYFTWAGPVYMDVNGTGERVSGRHEDRYLVTTETTVYTPTTSGPDAAILSGGNMHINANSGVISNQYGTISSGANLTLNGGNLNLAAYVAQAHDIHTTVTQREWLKTAGAVYCPPDSCIELYDESDNQEGIWYGGTTEEIRVLGSAIGTISAVGNISGNLSGELVTKIVSLGLNLDSQNPGNSGSGGSANRGSGAGGVSGNNVTVAGGNGQTQNTNGQTLAHNTNENGSGANAGSLTDIKIDLTSIVNAAILSFTNTGSDNYEATDRLQQEARDPNSLTNSGDGNQAEQLALNEIHQTPITAASERIHTGTDYDAADALDQAYENASGELNASAAEQLSGANASSGKEALNAYGLDNSVLGSAGERQSEGVAAVNADGSTVNANVLDVAEAAAIAAQAPVDTNAEPATANTVPPNPFSIDVAPGTVYPDNLGGLYVYNTAPNSNYLIEARPEFTDYAKFLGSDYLLNALGYNPDKTIKRLGDAFYENQLIRDALRSQTNTRFLGNATSDEAQMKLLMDNAVEANKSLQLRVGIALTAAQVAALTQDMIWLVEQVVNGQKVLVPQLYLASVDKSKLLPDGSLIAAGGGIDLQADKGINLEGTISAGSLLKLGTAGDFMQNGQLFSFGDVILDAAGAFTNNGGIQGDRIGVTAGGNLDNLGTVRADTGIWLESGDTLTNHSSGQVVSGGLLSLLSTNDLINQQGHLEGVDVLLKSETGNIVNRTEFEQVATRYGTGTRTVIGDSSTIISHNRLSLNAGNNLDLQGSQFNAANDISFTAGNDILLNAIENTRSSSVTGKTAINHSSTTWDGVSITAGNNLTMTAGRDIQAPGAQLTAGNNVSLSAGRDVNLLALANTNHLDITAKRKKVIDTDVVHTLASVNAGGNASVTAGQDINMIGATLAAGGNVALHAERDTNLVAVNDSDYHYDYTKQKKSFGRSTTTENESFHTTSVGTMVTAGGNLTINALLDEEGNVGLKNSRNVLLQGSLLSAGGDVVVGAGENITVTANTEEHLDFQLKKKSGLGGITGKSRTETGAEVTQVGSLVHSDKDVVMLAGNDLTLAGSTVNAGNNAELYAGLTNDEGDINIVALQHESLYESVSKKKSFSVDFSSDSVSFGKTNTKTQDNTSVSNAASYVLAGGNITGDAARDITVTGSVLDAGETLQLTSGRHITVQSGTRSDSMGHEGKTKTAGVSWAGDDNSVSLFAGHETIGQRTQQEYAGVAGSNLSGNNVYFDAGADINIIGSDLNADRSIKLRADNDVNILASHESANTSTRDTFTRDGLTLTANHNLGNAADAMGDIGGGDNAVSDASSVMKAMDAMNNIGPSGSAFLGQTTTTTTHKSISDQARGSSLNAGDDVAITAGNNATISGSQVNAGRNISVDANDIRITAAENRTTVNDTHEYDQVGATLSANQSGASLTIGFAKSESDHQQVIITTTGSSLNAGQDVSLNARNDLTIEGSDVNAARNIGLHAGNDVSIIAAQGHTRSTLDEEHLSGGAGVAIGANGVGVTAYVAAGENDLDRQNLIHRNATVTAGEGLTITSGRDANISGANLQAQDVDMDIGRNLTVASVQDTGSVEGRRWDASASITVGAGVSASANVGYGETEGSSAWVTDQTDIIGRNSVNIKVGGHTQVDGALIANITESGADGGNLNLDTRTFGFTDLKDHHEETSSYLSVGIGVNGGSGAKTGQDNPNAEGNSWSVSGSYYDLDRQQATNATIGQGTLTVRADAETGHDSTAGLNRDTSQSQVMTRDDETEIDVYVSSDSVKAARGLFQADEDGNNVTLTRWQNNVTSLADPDAYARIGANLHELSQVDGEALAQAWEQAKTTLGLVKVEVPDGSPMLEMIGERAGQEVMQRFENTENRSAEVSPDGQLQSVQIDGKLVWCSDGFIEEMTENLVVYEASGQRVDDVIALGQRFNEDNALFDADSQRNNDESLYGALGQSNMNNRDGYGLGLDLDRDTVSLNNYSERRQPDIEAFVSTYGPRNDVGDWGGDLRDIGMTLGGGFGHFVYDGATDLMGVGLTAGQLYLNPMDGVSAVSNGTSAGNQFTTWAQGNTDALVASFGPSPFIGGYGNEDLKDAYDYATLFTGAATATYGRKVGSVFDDIVSGTSANPSAAKLSSQWQGEYPYWGVDELVDTGLAKGDKIVQLTYRKDGVPTSSYFTSIESVQKAQLGGGAIDANILNQGLQTFPGGRSDFKLYAQVFQVGEDIPKFGAARGATAANPYFNPSQVNSLEQIFIIDDFKSMLKPTNLIKLTNTKTPEYLPLDQVTNNMLRLDTQ
jgi:filamentous hemagglutinin